MVFYTVHWDFPLLWWAILLDVLSPPRWPACENLCKTFNPLDDKQEDPLDNVCITVWTPWAIWHQPPWTSIVIKHYPLAIWRQPGHLQRGIILANFDAQFKHAQSIQIIKHLRTDPLFIPNSIPGPPPSLPQFDHPPGWLSRNSCQLVSRNGLCWSCCRWPHFPISCPQNCDEIRTPCHCLRLQKQHLPSLLVGWSALQWGSPLCSAHALKVGGGCSYVSMLAPAYNCSTVLAKVEWSSPVSKFRNFEGVAKIIVSQAIAC